MIQVTATKDKESFAPVTLTIRFDNKDELDLFGCLFCHNTICGFSVDESIIGGEPIEFKDDWCWPIRQAVKHVGGDVIRFVNAISEAFEKGEAGL